MWWKLLGRWEKKSKISERDPVLVSKPLWLWPGPSIHLEKIHHTGDKLALLGRPFLPSFYSSYPEWLVAIFRLYSSKSQIHDKSNLRTWESNCSLLVNGFWKKSCLWLSSAWFWELGRELGTMTSLCCTIPILPHKGAREKHCKTEARLYNKEASVQTSCSQTSFYTILHTWFSIPDSFLPLVLKVIDPASICGPNINIHYHFPGYELGSFRCWLMFFMSGRLLVGTWGKHSFLAQFGPETLLCPPWSAVLLTDFSSPYQNSQGYFTSSL